MDRSGCRFLLRSAACTFIALLLMLTGVFSAWAPVHAQGTNPTFFTVASGVVATEPSGQSWYASRLSLQPGEPMSDPAAGSPGFVLSTAGTVAVTDRQSSQITLLQPSSALFVSAAAELSFSSPSAEATVWRIAVAPAADAAPVTEGPGVERPLLTILDTDPAAPSDALQSIELRLGELDPGESASLGSADWSVPFVAALAGEGMLSDGSMIAAGRIVARSGSAAPVEVSANSGPAVIGYVAISPPFEPASLGLPDASNLPNPSGSGSGGNGPSAPAAFDPAPSTPTVGAAPTETPLDTSDADGDELSAAEEATLGTNPSNPDSDEDGLSDGNEVNDYATNPLALDTDGDGVTDNDEVMGQFGNLSPTLADTDTDGLSDGDELFIHHTNPILNDTDNDGESDGAEIAGNRDPLVLNDLDGDLLGDGLEAYYGTNPVNPDSDEDQLTDTYELFTTFTDPNRYDTDGDGTGDAVENASRTDPLDPASHP